MTALAPAGASFLHNISANHNYDYSPAQPAALDLAAALATLTPHTRAAYTRNLAAFRGYCDSCGWTVPTVALLRPLVLAAWLSHLRQCGRSPATCKQCKASVVWAARQAKQAEILDAAALADLADVAVPGGGGIRQGRWLEAADLRRLVRGVRGPGLRPVRDRAVLALLAGCALRRAELCSLTLAHLDVRDGEPVALINLVGKRLKVRSVAIPQWTRPYVVAWLRIYRERCDPAPTWPLLCTIDGGGDGTLTGKALRPASVYRILSAATVAAGLPEIAPHDLRRTAAKLMDDAGAGLTAIRDALGHSSVATTERYLQTASGPAMATLAMDKLMIAA